MIVDIFNTSKKYNVIYADPPWKYQSKQPFRMQGTRFHRLEEVYQTATVEDMSRWDIGRIAAPDCALFMWSTDSHLPEAIELMKAWGFKYRTVGFVWVKQTSKGNLVRNLGQWTLKSEELCLIGTKGRAHGLKVAHNIPQLVFEERTQHSKKPEAVPDLIEKMFGAVPRIELFARQTRPGWDCWGNEVTDK